MQIITSYSFYALIKRVFFRLFYVLTILSCSFSFVSYLATTTTLQFTFAALCWSNNTVVQRFSTAVLWRFRTYLNAIYQLSFIACMWCVKRITLGASCPGGTGV